MTTSVNPGVAYPRDLNSHAAEHAAMGLYCPRVILQSGAQISLTGSTALTVVARKTIPANTLKVGDSLSVSLLTSNNNNANAKTARIYIGSTVMLEDSYTTATTHCQEFNFYVRDSTHIVGPNVYGGPSYGHGYAGSSIGSAVVNLEAPIVLDIRLQLANSADTINLDAFRFVIIPGAGINEA